MGTGYVFIKITGAVMATKSSNAQAGYALKYQILVNSVSRKKCGFRDRKQSDESEIIRKNNSDDYKKN